MLWLAARWHKALKGKDRPKIFAATIDHGLRKEARQEARAVAKLAKTLRVPHRILKWTGAKPKSGIQENARAARYRLLAAEAKRVGATHLATAHTLDDQAETVLIRMSRGSGITGLGAIARNSRLDGLALIRPLLEISKARLVATVKTAKVTYADDPSNLDPKFTRVRLRGLMPALAQEGLDARRLAILARRLRRADAAIEAAADRATAELATEVESPPSRSFDAAQFARLPAEIALRLAARAITKFGTEGPVELGKLEALLHAARPSISGAATGRFRRSLAGALFDVADGKVLITAAPARRKPSQSAARKGQGKSLTTAGRLSARRAKAR